MIEENRPSEGLYIERSIAIANAYKGIRGKGDFFIACFSDEYTSKTKSYMNAELTLAINELQEYDTNREWFIPILLSDCDVPARSIGGGETLLDINWVPLYEDWDAGVQRILSAIKPISPEIKNLITALRSQDEEVCERAVSALGETSDPAAVPALIKVLKDKDEVVRAYAAAALEKINTPEAQKALE